MCGFAGELAPAGPADPGATARMARRLAPRGPDGHGTWAGGRVALSHRRLKIAPAAHHTTLGGSKLWQVGLLELWLQTHAVGGE